MSMKDLFSGIAVIIDDEVNKKSANISNIINQIESANIPILKYITIPPEEEIRHFQNLSFLLLDWRLIKGEINSEMIEEGVTIPDTLQEYDVSENIKFIKKLNEICFCPIFIFSNEDVNLIRSKLVSEKIMHDDHQSNIFVQSKIDLKGRVKLFNVVTKWLEKNPSIYVLKEWEKEYQSSKNKLFYEFQNISSVWPKVLWKNYIGDGVNPSMQLGEFISRNLHTRMSPFGFSEKIMKKRGAKILPKEIKHVLEGERFLTSLDSQSIEPGDIFKISSGNYYINIRASCDLISGRSENGNNDNIDLYLLKGSKISIKKGKKLYNKLYGLFPENETQSIIFPINEGEILDFRFKTLKILKWSEIKDKRIGRLLPPYITKIQQRYALYMQRQGLPKIPKEAIFD